MVMQARGNYFFDRGEGVKIMSATFRGGPLDPARGSEEQLVMGRSPSWNRVWCIL